MAKKSVTNREYRRMLSARQGRVKGRFQSLRPEQRVGYKSPKQPSSRPSSSPTEQAVANEVGLLESLIRQRKKLGIDTTELENYVLGTSNRTGVRSLVEDFIRENQEKFNLDDPAGAAAFQLMQEAVSLSEDSLKASREEAKVIYARLRFIRELAAKTKGRQSDVAKKLDQIIAPVEKQLKRRASFSEFMREKAQEFRRSIPERIVSRIPIVGGFLGEALRERRLQKDDLEKYTGYLQELISKRGRRSDTLNIGMGRSGRGASIASALGGGTADKLFNLSGAGKGIPATLGAIYKEVTKIRSLIESKSQSIESDSAELKAREAELEGLSKKASTGLGKTLVKSLLESGSGFSSFISQLLSGLISSILGSAIVAGIGGLFKGLFGKLGNLLRGLFNSLRFGIGGTPGPRGVPSPGGPMSFPAPTPLPGPSGVNITPRPMLPPPGGSTIPTRPMLPPPGGGGTLMRIGGGAGGLGVLSAVTAILPEVLAAVTGAIVGGGLALTYGAISDSLFGTDWLEYQLRGDTWTGADIRRESEIESKGKIQEQTKMDSYKKALKNPNFSATEMEFLPDMVRRKMLSGEEAIRRVVRFEAMSGADSPMVKGGYTKHLKERIARADEKVYNRRMRDKLGITGEQFAKQQEAMMREQAERANAVAAAATASSPANAASSDIRAERVREIINGRYSEKFTVNGKPVKELETQTLKEFVSRLSKRNDLPPLLKEAKQSMEEELSARSKEKTGILQTPPTSQTTVGQMYSDYNSQREGLSSAKAGAEAPTAVARVDNSRTDTRINNVTNHFNDDIRIRNNEPTQKQMQAFSLVP